MKKAKDYIIFPLDVSSEEEAGRYVDLLSDWVGMFKVGLELFIRCGPDIVRRVLDSGPAGVFLDLKLHDIPETVRRAMLGISELGADLATVHCGGSRAMLEAAVSGAAGKVKVLGVTVLTSLSNQDIREAGFREELSENLDHLVLKRAAMAREAGLAGVVCSPLEAGLIKSRIGRDFLAVTPGVRPAWEGVSEDDQRRVSTPAGAVANGSDYLVVGRPIRDAKDPREAARRIAEEIEPALAIRESRFERG